MAKGNRELIERHQTVLTDSSTIQPYLKLEPKLISQKTAKKAVSSLGSKTVFYSTVTFDPRVFPILEYFV